MLWITVRSNKRPYQLTQLRLTNTFNPHTFNPHTFNPHTFNPHTFNPHTFNPHTFNPHTFNPHTFNPHTFNPHTFNPHTFNPHTFNPHTFNPHTFNPHSVTLILGRRRVAPSVASTRFPDIDMELGMQEISPAREDVSSGRSHAHVVPCCSRIITVVRRQSSRVGDSGVIVWGGGPATGQLGHWNGGGHPSERWSRERHMAACLHFSQLGR